MNIKNITQIQLSTNYAKRLRLILWSLLLVVFVNAYADSSSSTVNQLCFENITGLNFTNVVTKVTGNTGLTVDVNTKTSCITATTTVARDRSSGVVGWVNAHLTGGSQWVREDMGTGRFNLNPPDKLNFAIQGDLSFMYHEQYFTCTGVIFGQGKSGAYNNWWGFANTSWYINDINYNFSNNIQEYPTGSEFMLSCNNDTEYLYLIAKGSYTFKVDDTPTYLPDRIGQPG